MFPSDGNKADNVHINHQHVPSICTAKLIQLLISVLSVAIPVYTQQCKTFNFIKMNIKEYLQIQVVASLVACFKPSPTKTPNI